MGERLGMQRSPKNSKHSKTRSFGFGVPTSPKLLLRLFRLFRNFGIVEISCERLVLREGFVCT